MSARIGVAAGHRRAVVLIAGALCVAAAAALPVDVSQDALSAATGSLATLTVPVVAVLVAVSVLHYLAAAAAARAAAGTPLPSGELIAAQLAAAAANRLTPAGLGAATVNGRYLVRRGRRTVTQAAAAVSALSVLGAVADVVAFAGLVLAGTAAGWSGAAAELPLLASRLLGFVPVPGRWWEVAAGGVLAAGGAVVMLRRRSSATAARLHRSLGEFAAAVQVTLRRPARVAELMLASAGTTLALATGFAAAAVVGPAGPPASLFCALMIGYMAASAAGNALPVPGGIGTADAALVGVLVAAHEAAGAAVAAVLAFRVVTFWAPAVVGLGAARALRRRGAL